MGPNGPPQAILALLRWGAGFAGFGSMRYRSSSMCCSAKCLWWDLVTNAGFLVRALREPRPTADDVAAQPALDDSFRLPYFLIIDAQRGRAG